MSESYHGGGLRKGKGPSVGSSNAPAKSTGVKMPEDLAFAPTLVHGGKGSGLLLSVATDEDVVYATTLFPGDGKYGAGLAAINSQEDLAILGEYGTQSDLGSGSLSDISLYKDRDIDTPLQSNEDTANNSLDVSPTLWYPVGKSAILEATSDESFGETQHRRISLDREPSNTQPERTMFHSRGEIPVLSVRTSNESKRSATKSTRVSHESTRSSKKSFREPGVGKDRKAERGSWSSNRFETSSRISGVSVERGRRSAESDRGLFSSRRHTSTSPAKKSTRSGDSDRGPEVASRHSGEAEHWTDTFSRTKGADMGKSIRSSNESKRGKTFSGTGDASREGSIAEKGGESDSPQVSSDDSGSPRSLRRRHAKRRPMSVYVSATGMPVEDDTTDLTSSSKKTHRLSYNGHQDHHIAALQTLARSGSISLTGPLVAEPEDSESSRESSSASLAELYKYERPGDKKSLRRIHAMTELLDTERTYVHDLRVLVEGCFDRLNAASWLTSENRFLLMRNANDLYKFQQEFLAALEEAMSGFDASPDNDLVPVAKVFLEMREKFQVYKGYCTQHDGAVRILTEYEKRPEMISFLQDFKGRAQTRLDLKDYLIKPVQRVCRYPLLLHELIKNTEEESNDYQDLLGAYSEMQSLAVEIDAAKSMIEKLERTDRFFARLENTLQIDIPKRTECGEMVFGGGLFIVNHDLFAPKIKYRGIFVFGNAYLMVVKPKRATVYNLKLCIPLSAYEFRYLGSRECPLPFAFRLRHAEGSQYYDFGTQSDKERAAWGEVLVQLTRPPTGTRSRHQSPSVEPAPLAGVSPTAPKRTGSAGSLSSLNTLSTMASIDESALAAAIASERELQHQQSGRRKFWRQSSVEVDRSGSGMGGPYVFARRPSVDYKMFDVVTFFPDSRESWGPSARTARSAHDLKDCSPSSGQFPELQSASSMPGLADRSSINDPRRSRLIGPPLVVLRQISEPSFHNGPLQRSPEQHHHHSYSADAASGDLDDSRQTILHGPPLRNTRSVISFRTMNMLFSSSAPTSPGPMGATSPPGTSTTNTNTGPPVPVRTSFSSFRGPGSHMLNRYPSRSSSRSMASWTSDSSVGAATVEEDEEEGSAEGGKEGKGKGSGGAKRVYKTWSQIFSKGSKKLGFKKGGKMAGAGAGAGGGSAGGAGGGGPPAGEGAGKLR